MLIVVRGFLLESNADKVVSDPLKFVAAVAHAFVRFVTSTDPRPVAKS